MPVEMQAEMEMPAPEAMPLEMVDTTTSPLSGATDTPVPPPSPDVEPEAPARCTPANGVSGSPETISQAIILINTLPKPTTLECFVQALDRPLTVYMTKSDDSLQPSPGARSPRTFFLRGKLEMSIVLDGSASNTLEFGFRPEPSRSIKAEIEFPVRTDVSETSLFDRVQVTPRTTKCGACHVGEAHEEFPGFPLGVFVSDVLSPFELDEVSLDSMRSELESCDLELEPYRCGLLSAIFDHGEVLPGQLQATE
jgi:hypothetical protein